MLSSPESLFINIVLHTVLLLLNILYHPFFTRHTCIDVTFWFIALFFFSSTVYAAHLLKGFSVKSRIFKTSAFALSALLVLAACSSEPEPAPLPPPLEAPVLEPDPADDFSVDDARQEANALLGVSEAELSSEVRVARRGDEEFMLTQDYVLGRFTVELDDQGAGFTVVKVTVELPNGPETFTLSPDVSEDPVAEVFHPELDLSGLDDATSGWVSAPVFSDALLNSFSHPSTEIEVVSEVQYPTDGQESTSHSLATFFMVESESLLHSFRGYHAQLLAAGYILHPDDPDILTTSFDPEFAVFATAYYLYEPELFEVSEDDENPNAPTHFMSCRAVDLAVSADPELGLSEVEFSYASFSGFEECSQ